MRLRDLLLLVPAVVLWHLPCRSAAADAVELPQEVTVFLQTHCTSCHSGDTTEGGVRLDTFEQLPLEPRLELMNKVQQQVFFELMPPVGESIPADSERDELLRWLTR